MPDVQEVFRMATQKVDQDPGARERLDREQRRRVNRRRVGVYALVACLMIGAALFAFEGFKDHGTSPPSVPVSPGGSAEGLSIVDVGTGETTAFTAPLNASRFDFAPDGSRVTYIDSDENGDDQVFVMGADGSSQRQLTHSPNGVEVPETSPQWSPDGSRIAYWVSLPAGGVELFVVRVSDGVSTRVTHEPKDVYEGGWASDRSFVFSTSNPSSDYPLLARSIDVETGETRTIARDLSTPEVAPDETQIAFDSYFHPQGEAWLSLINIDGTDRRKIQRVGYSSGSLPKWSPDSTQIAFIGDSAKSGSGTYVYNLTTGETRFVTAGATESWIDDDHILVS